MKISLKTLAEKLGASLHFPGNSESEVILTSVAPIDKAGPGDVTFCINPEYFKFASTTKAGAVIVAEPITDCSRPQIIHAKAYWAFATTFQMFVTPRIETGRVHPEAWVAEGVKLGRDVTVYPGAFVSEGVEIGDNSVIFPGVYLGRGVKIGMNSILRANVVVEDGCVIGDRVLIHGNTTIGADGFGFAPGSENIAKIPQIGIVRIEDDVEIGAGCSIDRAAMGETVIGRDCKLDSSVHVAHGVKLGAHSMACGGAAIGGSAKIGQWVVLAGSTSVSNHVEIGDKVTIGALAGVTKSLRDAGEYMGFPAVPANQWRREVASVRRLKSMEERLRNLEERLTKNIEK